MDNGNEHLNSYSVIFYLLKLIKNSVIIANINIIQIP